MPLCLAYCVRRAFSHYRITVLLSYVRRVSGAVVACSDVQSKIWKNGSPVFSKLRPVICTQNCAAMPRVLRASCRLSAPERYNAFLALEVWQRVQMIRAISGKIKVQFFKKMNFHLFPKLEPATCSTEGVSLPRVAHGACTVPTLRRCASCTALHYCHGLRAIWNVSCFHLSARCFKIRKVVSASWPSHHNIRCCDNPVLNHEIYKFLGIV